MAKGPIGALLHFLEGGKETFISLARIAPQIDPEISRFVEEWDRTRLAVRMTLDLDELCAAKNLDSAHVIAVVGEAAIKFRDNASVMIAALNMPSVVQRSVKKALTNDGVADRKMLFEHSGFLPTPQGSRISILNQVAARAEVNNEVQRGLPSFERTIEMAEEALEES